MINQKGTRQLSFKSGTPEILKTVADMRKELHHVDISNLQKALRKSGYKKVGEPSSSNKHWRKGVYHLVIEERSGKVSLEIHEDLPYHVGTINKGKQLKREIQEIIRTYRELQKKKGPPQWS